MTKNQIKSAFVRALEAGTLIDVNRLDQIEVFNVCMDKYSDIIHQIQNKNRVLDAGCAGGILLSMLNEMGHECHGVDITDCSEEYPYIYKQKNIKFTVGNIEIDPLPYPDD